MKTSFLLHRLGQIITKFVKKFVTCSSTSSSSSLFLFIKNCVSSTEEMEQEDHNFSLTIRGTELSTDTRKKPHCSYCKNHRKECTTRQHNCPYKTHCDCVLCVLTEKAQLIMRHQQRVWRFQNQKNANGDSTRFQKCDNCRNHGEFTRKSSHTCPYEDCDCSYCILTSKRRQIMKHIQRFRRLNITMDSNCDGDGPQETQNNDKDFHLTVEAYSKQTSLDKEQLESLLTLSMRDSYPDMARSQRPTISDHRSQSRKIRVGYNRQNKKEPANKSRSSTAFDHLPPNAYHQNGPSINCDQLQLDHPPQRFKGDEKELPNLIRLRDLSNNNTKDSRIDTALAGTKILNHSPPSLPSTVSKRNINPFPSVKIEDPLVNNFGLVGHNSEGVRRDVVSACSVPPSYPWHTPSVFPPGHLLSNMESQTGGAIRQPVRPKPILANIPTMPTTLCNFPIPDWLYLNSQWQQALYARDIHLNYNRNSLFTSRHAAKYSNFLGAMAVPGSLPPESLMNGLAPWIYPVKE